MNLTQEAIQRERHRERDGRMERHWYDSRLVQTTASLIEILLNELPMESSEPRCSRGEAVGKEGGCLNSN